MLWKPDVIADIALLRSSEGGRQTAISPPGRAYHGTIGFEGEYFDCRIDLSDVAALAPGGRARLPLKFLSPELVLRRLALHAAFTLWEGKTIGHGTVVEVCREAV